MIRPAFWDYTPDFPGVLNFIHSPYMAHYKTRNGRIILTLCPVFGEYNEQNIQTGKFVGYVISFKGYSGFLPFEKAKESIREMIVVALTRELE